MNVRAHLIVIALMAFLAGWVHAQADQAVDASKPESVAGEALAALKDNRIDDFAALMHPQLRRCRKCRSHPFPVFCCPHSSPPCAWPTAIGRST